MSNPILDVTNKAIESQDLTNKFMSKALEYLNSAEAFTKSEVPKYIEELLNFKFYENLISLVPNFLGLSMASIVVIIVIVIYRKTDNFDKRFVSILIGLTTVLFISIPIKNITGIGIELVKIKTAPRVYLIDYIRGQK